MSESEDKVIANASIDAEAILRAARRIASPEAELMAMATGNNA